MAKANASYETIFVVDLRLGEDAVKSVVEKFTSMIGANGEIAEVNEWGKRRFAYPDRLFENSIFRLKIIL